MADVKEFEYEFNPVKELKDNVGAEVWTTKSILKAVDAIEKGLPLKANPFCGKNVKLLKPDLVYKRTPEEIDDYIHCMQDLIYFAEKCYIMTPEGLQAVKMRDYQIEYLRCLQENRFNILLACRQAGKSISNAIFCLWKILFNVDKNGMVLSKSGPAGQDVIKKIKDMYIYLPYHLKCGTMKWNQHEISFDNNSTIHTEAFSETAGLGSTLNFLMLDEFAWCPPNQVQLFYQNVIPTITTISDSNVCICSTQNGFNLFYELWNGAITGKNAYHPYKIDWYQVPQWNVSKKCWEKRTEKWKQEMIGILGSEENFYYQYGTQFAVSDRCIVSRECLSKIHEHTVAFVNNDNLLYDAMHKECLMFNPNFDIAKLKTNRFVILVDLAEGGGGDYTIFNIFEIIDKDHFEQIGYWRSNSIDIEKAALEFWLTVTQLFNNANILISIEWNTYGALFFSYLLNLNESEMYTEYNWRFTYASELDLETIIRYKKGDNTDDLAGLSIVKNIKMIPGIRFNSANKITACALLKMALEKGEINVYDVFQITEMENFEDKNGTGTYKASFGHDDLMMTLCQLPMLKQTMKFKEFIDGDDGDARDLLSSIDVAPDMYSAFNDFYNLTDTIYG